MTAKKDFKRRVRQRQERTGESYVTARRHLIARQAGAAGPPGGDPDEPSPDPAAGSAPDPEVGAPLSVVELVDVSAQARAVGLVCPVRMFPALAARVAPARVLGRLRDLLVAMIGDPSIAAIAGLALTGQPPAPRKPQPPNLDALRRFFQRANAGLGGAFDDGSLLAFHVADGDGMVPILCSLATRDTALVINEIADLVTEPLGPIGSMLFRALLPGPLLYVVHEGRRYPVTRSEFVIGRSAAVADLAIKDGNVSRKHAAVIRSNGGYYLKDLGSTHGIVYKGMRIDSKRIDEGDAFELGGHEIRFTFRDQ